MGGSFSHGHWMLSSGRQRSRSVSLSYADTLTATSRSLLRRLSAVTEGKVEETLVDFTCIKAEDRHSQKQSRMESEYYALL